MKAVLLVGVALFVFSLGAMFGMLTGHVVILKDDGSVCAEVK